MHPRPIGFVPQNAAIVSYPTRTQNRPIRAQECITLPQTTTKIPQNTPTCHPITSLSVLIHASEANWLRSAECRDRLLPDSDPKSPDPCTRMHNPAPNHDENPPKSAYLSPDHVSIRVDPCIRGQLASFRRMPRSSPTRLGTKSPDPCT